MTFLLLMLLLQKPPLVVIEKDFHAIYVLYLDLEIVFGSFKHEKLFRFKLEKRMKL